MVWVISSSAPLWFLFILYILRWEWWYLAPKESLLLIWLWIMQGFIWCQTMWQSSAVLYMYYILYGLWWTKAVYYIQYYYVVGLFSNPHGLFFSLLFALLPPSSTTTKLGDNPTDPKLCQSRNCFHRHQYLKVEKGANSSVIIYRVFWK